MRLIVGFTALFLFAAMSQASGNECSALQVEVETLRARLKAYEAASAPLALPALAPVAAAAPELAPPTPPAAAAAVLPGAAAKPAPVQRVVIEEPYSRTGCSKGLFKGIDPAPWQEATLWLDLEKGLTAAEVEALLGVEHYDERGGRNVIWHYGKCGASSKAQALFVDGKLADWRAPSG